MGDLIPASNQEELATAEAHGWMDVQCHRHDPTKGVLGVAALTDDALARFMRTCQRAIEDGQQTEMYARLLAKARGQYLARFALRMRYGAVDNHIGTDSYDRWYRLDEPPTYRFAAGMDLWRAQHGQRHILVWPAASLAVTAEQPAQAGEVTG
jgi:hypothetical protein